jgi:hypothetical protein
MMRSSGRQVVKSSKKVYRSRQRGLQTPKLSATLVSSYRHLDHSWVS